MDNEKIEAVLKKMGFARTDPSSALSTKYALDDAADLIRDLRTEIGNQETKIVDLEEARPADSFQHRVQGWMMQCFSMEVCRDRQERNHRFLEEALELVQACGCTVSEAHQLVDYVYGRDQGEINQEVGGVMVTLAALCLANDIDMHIGGEVELLRILQPAIMEKIRAKQAAKPKHSPLPAHPAADNAALIAAVPGLVEALELLVSAAALQGVRSVVAGWNGEGREEPYRDRHPRGLGATLPKTTCGAVYDLDDAMQLARAALASIGRAQK